MSDSSATAPTWTCGRCEMTVSWMPGCATPERPANWVEQDGSLYCLGCRRELAGEAGVSLLGEEASAEDRQKRERDARIEFEVLRDPERPDNQIAKACRTSVVAVRRARERLGATGTE